MAKESKNLYAKIIARAWKDEAFKRKLLSNPKETLKESGIDVPTGAKMHVFEETPTNRYFILPQSPSQARDLSVAELEKIAAAKQEYTPNGCIG